VPVQAFAGPLLPCYRVHMRKLMLLLTFLACVTSAWAQRTLPADAKRATIGVPQALPVVQLGKELLRLAPGGIIVDAQNRTVTHNQIPPGGDALYLLNRNGEITRMVILTPEEQARLKRAK